MKFKNFLLVISLTIFLMVVYASTYLIIDTEPPVTQIKDISISGKWVNSFSNSHTFKLVCKDAIITIDNSTQFPGIGCENSYYKLVKNDVQCDNSNYQTASNKQYFDLNTLNERMESRGYINYKPSECGEVCIFKVCFYSTDKNDNIESPKISTALCYDSKKPMILNVEFFPEIKSKADSNFDPYPNYFIDFNGNVKTLVPDLVVIDKEGVNINVSSRDKADITYLGTDELSGLKKVEIKYRGTTKPEDLGSVGCGEKVKYNPPYNLSKYFFGSAWRPGWNNVSVYVYDQADNMAENSRTMFYTFLGARGDQQNQRGTDKIVFLKTYWDSVSEIKQRTNNLGAQSSKKINCFGYSNKCTFIRDIIGKTDDFTDCLWVGPSNNPRNVKIYNFKEGVDLEKNEKLIPNFYKDFGNRIVFAWQDIAPVNSKIAFCSKNDTGILVDLPNLVSKDIKDGFQILPSTEKRFSVIWQVEYAREQREVAVECYLNPVRNDGYTVCTIDDILNNKYGCTLDSGQKCYCGNTFPCIQDTSKETIQSCSVENPRYFSGTNRIICRFYDPRDKGIRAEVWYNHEFYYERGLIFNKKENIAFLLSKVIEKYLFSNFLGILYGS